MEACRCEPCPSAIRTVSSTALCNYATFLMQAWAAKLTSIMRIIIIVITFTARHGSFGPDATSPARQDRRQSRTAAPAGIICN